MKSHVDKLIAFRYPGDLLLSNPVEGQYCLQRGHTFFLIRPLTYDFDWRMSIAEAGRVMKMPQHDVVRRGTGIPGGKAWSETYERHGFSGKRKTYLSYNISNEFSGKSVIVAVERGGHRMEIRAADRADFPDESLDELLASVAFPGEKAYESFVQDEQQDDTVASQYSIVLPLFATLGAASQDPNTRRFNVTYDGGAIDVAQTKALEDFTAAEADLFENAKTAIFKYYVEFVRPTMTMLAKGVLPRAAISRMLPPAKTPDDVIRLIEFSCLEVHAPRTDGTVPIGIRLSCNWDEEHGLGLRTLGTNVEAVGTDAVALVSDLVEWPGFSLAGARRSARRRD